jgi:hypothetical protein
MMKVKFALAVPALALGLSACGGGSFLTRDKPDEFAVSRAAPLVIPPDFALTPPKPGAPRPLEVDSQGQALRALFGDTARSAPKSGSEQNLLDQSGATPDATIGARSNAGDPQTNVINKGVFTAELVNQPVTEGNETASVRIGG